MVVVGSAARYVVPQRPLRPRIAHYFRILRVLARTEFKLKYAGSVLGYAWSLIRPLLYFAVLWVVFARLFKTSVPRFPLYLISGITLYTFLADAVSLTLPSIVARGAVLRRIAFPSLLIPLATTTTALMTFLLNSIAVLVFFFASGVGPELGWFLIVPLVVELYVFVLGLALVGSTLYVRFRDVAQIWDVLAPLLLFSTPIMYPTSILPPWAREVIAFSPLAQVVQDSRRLMLGNDPRIASLFAAPESRIYPILIAIAVLCVGLWLNRSKAPRFPELV
jgi:ABC-2 type transport system permease protein